MSVAANKRGLKRVCIDCGNRFYDFNKRPIICSTCETEFTGVEKIKTRRGRVAKVEEPVESKDKGQVIEKTAKEVANDEEADEEEEIGGVEVISLDDLETVTPDVEEGENDSDLRINLDGDDDLDDLEVGVEIDSSGPDDLESDEDTDIKQ